MRKIYVTEKQLNEIIDSNGMFSSSPIKKYETSTISTTEPFDNGEEGEFGEPMTGDDKQKNMAPGLFQRMTSRGVYGGPLV